jgi:hypothetical protein
MSHAQSRPEAARANRRAPGALIPVCGWCGKVRDEAGSWIPAEQNLPNLTGRILTHGVCPDCAGKLFPRRRTAA